MELTLEMKRSLMKVPKIEMCPEKEITIRGNQKVVQGRIIIQDSFAERMANSNIFVFLELLDQELRLEDLGSPDYPRMELW